MNDFRLESSDISENAPVIADAQALSRGHHAVLHRQSPPHIEDPARSRSLIFKARGAAFMETMQIRTPRIIWMLWLQGWESAPPVAHASLASWNCRNPGWRVNALDRKNLRQFIPPHDLDRIFSTPKELEAVSDQVRFELLHRYGGVWADATTISAYPLDDWLPDVMNSGFFAFSRPSPDRMLSTWFLAAEIGSYVVEKWRTASIAYWTDRNERDHYFWPHNLFAEAYRSDPRFRAIWDTTPERSAAHDLHFEPNSPSLYNPPTPAHLRALEAPPVPVFKLTYKFDRPYESRSLMAAICAFAQAGSRADPGRRAPKPKRILVGWYGSFAGHGTIGDWRSLQSVVSHLIALGHTVTHATAADFEIPGAAREEDWASSDPAALDAALFVCGPILKDHPWSRQFFEHFSSIHLAGIGVSLLPEDDPNRHNPFHSVFARQGGARDFGDVAITAPMDIFPQRAGASGSVIGIVLRGEQSEYGLDRCLWRETQDIVHDIVLALRASGSCKVVAIENHLTRSGLSPAEIERQYADCDLIITSRFHGAITALRHCVPFIAIDHIKGGAKVYDLLARLGWPHVVKIDDADAQALSLTARELLRSAADSALMAARRKAIVDANHALGHLEGWAASLS